MIKPRVLAIERVCFFSVGRYLDKSDNEIVLDKRQHCHTSHQTILKHAWQDHISTNIVFYV